CGCHLVDLLYCFFCAEPPTSQTYTLSLHDALPILPLLPVAGGCHLGEDDEGALQPRVLRQSCRVGVERGGDRGARWYGCGPRLRSEEHTSELQSRFDLVCRLLLEKKKARRHMQRSE